MASSSLVRHYKGEKRGKTKETFRAVADYYHTNETPADRSMVKGAAKPRCRMMFLVSHHVRNPYVP
jgi:hypothetical protein